jgi:fumarate hydratase, class II
MVLTCLVPKISYDVSLGVARNADKRGDTPRESSLELKARAMEEVDKIVRPELMIAPGSRTNVDQSCFLVVGPDRLPEFARR